MRSFRATPTPIIDVEDVENWFQRLMILCYGAGAIKRMLICLPLCNASFCGVLADLGHHC